MQFSAKHCKLCWPYGGATMWELSNIHGVLISAAEMTALVSWRGQENNKWHWTLQEILRKLPKFSSQTMKWSEVVKWWSVTQHYKMAGYVQQTDCTVDPVIVFLSTNSRWTLDKAAALRCTIKRSLWRQSPCQLYVALNQSPLTHFYTQPAVRRAESSMPLLLILAFCQ